MNKKLALALALVVPLLLARCGRAPHDLISERVMIGTSGTFASIYATTLQPACAECHVPGGSATSQGVTLDFSSQGSAYATLVGGKVSGEADVGICGGIPYVAKGNPAASFLAGVLFEQYNTNDFAGVSGCQPYTAHLQDQHLSADEQASIVAWIKGGAPNN